MLPIPVSLEGLRIANATIDIIQRNSSRFALAFARHFGDEPVAIAAGFATSDAVIVGQDLLGSLHVMAVHLEVMPFEKISPALHRTVADPALRAALDRAFVAAFQTIVPPQGRAMIVSAWHGLLTAFLGALDDR